MHTVMNTTDYTICNLDSQTYTTGNHDVGGYGSSSHHNSIYNHFNGLNANHLIGGSESSGHGTSGGGSSTGGGGYSYGHHPGHGGSPILQQQQQSNGHHGSSSSQCTLPIEIQPTCGPVSPYDTGGGSVISHTNNSGQYTTYGQHHHHQGFNPAYYTQGTAAGLMPNGCIPPDLSGASLSGSYPPSPYTDHLSYGPGGLMHPNQCSSPGGFVSNGGVPQNPGQAGEGPVTTYKWMTVKRSQPKTSPQSECTVFLFLLFYNNF